MKAPSHQWWKTPNGVLTIAFAMYAFKVAAKLILGSSIHSPMITGDGWHNVADLVQVGLVAAAVLASRRPPNGEYPFGWKNVESIVQTVIGASMCFVALMFAGASIAGLLSYVPDLDRSVRDVAPFLPHHEPLRMGSDVVGWVTGITGVSVLLSFVVGRHEVAVGKAHGHCTMVSDGQEACGDGLIEATILVGILAEYLFHAPWLEYVFGLGVVFLITRTGMELLLGGWRALLQKSLGHEVEAALQEACRNTHGVIGTGKIVTFAVGSCAICNLEILSEAPTCVQGHIKRALQRKLRARLGELGREESEIYLQFSPPPAAVRRVAYAVVHDGKAFAIAPTLETATHAIIRDEQGVAGGDAMDRRRAEALPSCQADRIAWLEHKRVETLYVFGRPPGERCGALRLVGLPTYDLSMLGH